MVDLGFDLRFSRFATRHFGGSAERGQGRGASQSLRLPQRRLALIPHKQLSHSEEKCQSDKPGQKVICGLCGLMWRPCSSQRMASSGLGGILLRKPSRCLPLPARKADAMWTQPGSLGRGDKEASPHRQQEGKPPFPSWDRSEGKLT